MKINPKRALLIMGILLMSCGRNNIPAEFTFDYFGEEPPELETKQFNPLLSKEKK